MSDVRLFSAHNPGPYTGDGNNTWLIDGDAPALVDAGTGESAHIDAIAAALGGRPLACVIVTHGHADHASGVPALRARWPDLRTYKWRLAGDEHWLPLTEGQRIAAGDRTLHVVHTPGHAADHVCLWDEERREAYTGDMLIRSGSVLIPAGRGGNLRDYLRSLERLRALEPIRCLPGHGEVIDRPREVIAQYISHRQQREAQVLACLADGVTDVDAIVDRLYVGLQEGLRHAARLTIQAHLDKVHEDAGRAASQ